MLLIDYIIQGFINDIMYIPIELLLVLFLAKFMFHQDLKKLFIGDKSKKGLYITAEQFNDNGQSSGSLQLSIQELMDAGALMSLQNENQNLKTEIKKLKEKMSK